jgi:hypothetical protein
MLVGKSDIARNSLTNVTGAPLLPGHAFLGQNCDMPTDVVKKPMSTYIKVVIAIIGLLAFYFYNHFQAQRGDWQQALDTNRDLSIQMWCSNNDLTPDGNGGFNTSGGWPCIKVSSFSPLKKGPKDPASGHLTICSSVTLAREVGLPGQETYQDYNTATYCPFYSSDGFGSIGADIFSKEVKNDLDLFSSQECKTLGERLTPMDHARLCYGMT